MSSTAITKVKSVISHIRHGSTTHYDPPPGPPPSKDRPAKHSTPPVHQPYVHEVELPLVEAHKTYNLAAQGWTTLSLSPTSQKDSRAAQLRSATSGLFAAAKNFFDREDEYKSQFVSNKMGSEEGFNSIPGEKQFFTIRSTQLLPEELRAAAETYWSTAGDLLHDMLARVAESVEFKPEALTQLSDGCRRLGTEPTATMLRVFRYEGWEDKVVAEPHADLGLLSLVSGQSPGLEVWNSTTQSYYAVERQAPDLSSMASLLSGRQLQRLTNGVYAPGGHLVRSYPPDASMKAAAAAGSVTKKYRFSIVFVLRAHYPVTLQRDMFTSPLTGVPATIEDGMTAKELFAKIKGIHYNINIGHKTREEQKKKLAAKRGEAENGSIGIA